MIHKSNKSVAGVNGVQCNEELSDGSAIVGMRPGQPHLLQGFQRLLSHLLFQQECCLRVAQYSTGNCKENKCWSQCIRSVSVAALCTCSEIITEKLLDLFPTFPMVVAKNATDHEEIQALY